MKKALIISYYFPPAGGSAVQRVAKFVKYLGHNGWQPVVLTARERDFALYDNSMLKDIPQKVSVYRTAAPDLYHLYGQLGQKEQKDHVELSALAVETGKGSAFKRFALWIRAMFFIPDARIAWLPFAVIEGLKIIRKENIRIIFTTSPPFTTALVGGFLSKLTGVPWISDYRDPWTQAYFYYKRPQFVQFMEDHLEKWLLKGAKRVLSINRLLIENLKRKYELGQDEKWKVISNGFDNEDFKEIKPVQNDQFTIVYTGTVNTKMNPASLFKSIQLLKKSDPELHQKIRLVFIGRIGSDVSELFQNPEIESMIQRISHLSHQNCLKHIMGADLLLLLIPQYENNRLIMTNKLFEYMRSGNPILCLDKYSLAAEVIRETGTGLTLSSDDIEGICQTVRALYQKWEKGNALLSQPVNWDAVNRYDRQRLTGKLADLMNEVIGRDKD
ncbi:glycosyltransferase [bacterium]